MIRTLSPLCGVYIIRDLILGTPIFIVIQSYHFLNLRSTHDTPSAGTQPPWPRRVAGSLLDLGVLWEVGGVLAEVWVAGLALAVALACSLPS